MKNHHRRISMFLLLGGFFAALVHYPAAFGAEPLSDQQITDAVEDEIQADGVIPLARIFVRTSAGIVKLSGAVDNLLAKERAARVAATVRGVRSIINELVVTPFPRGDREIETDIKGALVLNPATEARNIDVKVTNSVVTLSGKVNSGRERELAEKLAKSVKGVKEVRDALSLQFPKSRSDADIREDVVQGLKWDALVDPSLVRVDAKDGKVILSGKIASVAERIRAMSLAWVTGVKDVDSSQLDVDSSLRRGSERRKGVIFKSDDAIRKAVQHALMLDPRADSFKILVEVTGRIVTLRGRVRTLAAKQAAEQDARNTVGVILVRNRLKVNPGQETEDGQIAEVVRRALATNPFVDTNRIDVAVVGGIAYLTGDALTSFESRQAEYTASGVKGVLDVVNRIDIRDMTPSSSSPLAEDEQVFHKEPAKRDFMPALSLTEDDQIKQRIVEAMSRNPLVDVEQVKVAVDGGVATLTGTADSIGEYNAAAIDAYKAGATSVVNKLKLK